MEVGSLLKKLVEALNQLVTEANFDCSISGISLQAMDNAHCSLSSLLLSADGFTHYRCDRRLTLGINLASMTKLLKCCGNDDSVMLHCDGSGDTVTFVFESPSGDKISDFELRLMDIDSENLGIPDEEYPNTVSMSSVEFQRIVRDMNIFGDAITIDLNKEGVKFSASGDLGNGNILLKHSSGVSVDAPRAKASKPKGEGVKKEKNVLEDDEDEEAGNDEDVEQMEVEAPKKSSRRAEESSGAVPVLITMKKPIKQRFALRYLNLFAKATSLAEKVTLHLKEDIPLMVEYQIAEMGFLRYYLAPKIDEEED